MAGFFIKDELYGPCLEGEGQMKVFCGFLPYHLMISSNCFLLTPKV